MSVTRARQDEASASASSRVKVIVRVRPSLEREARDGCVQSCVGVDRRANKIFVGAKRGGAVVVNTDADPPGGGGVRQYTFDKVLPAGASEEDVYEGVLADATRRFARGYNVTVFAYGQTGSGKTHTIQNVLTRMLADVLEFARDNKAIDGDDMPLDVDSAAETAAAATRDEALDACRVASGDDEQLGDDDLSPFAEPTAEAAAAAAFAQDEAVDECPASGDEEQPGGDDSAPDAEPEAATTSPAAAAAAARMSVLQLYQGVLTDLLAPAAAAAGSSGAGLRMRESAKGAMEVQDAIAAGFSTSAEALALAAKAASRRVTCSTGMNAVSSRSHLIYQITLGDRRSVKLNVVDLAGSERVKLSQVAGDVLRQAISINTDLLAVVGVVRAITARAGHVPYRNSKLTLLLQDSLGGDCRTVMIATVSPAQASSFETRSTLDFAVACGAIVNHPVRRHASPQPAKTRRKSAPAAAGSGRALPWAAAHGGAPQYVRYTVATRLGPISVVTPPRGSTSAEADAIPQEFVGGAVHPTTSTSGKARASMPCGLANAQPAPSASAEASAISQEFLGSAVHPEARASMPCEFPNAADSSQKGRTGVIPPELADRAVFMLHGCPSSAAEHAPWFACLRYSEVWPVAIDQPGFGHTPGTPHRSRSEHNLAAGGPVDVLLAVMDALGVAAAHVLGYDWGGGAALSAGLRHPLRVKSLVVLLPSYAEVNQGELSKLRPGTTVAWDTDDQFHSWKKWRRLAQSIPKVAIVAERPSKAKGKFAILSAAIVAHFTGADPFAPVVEVTEAQREPARTTGGGSVTLVNNVVLKQDLASTVLSTPGSAGDAAAGRCAAAFVALLSASSEAERNAFFRAAAAAAHVLTPHAGLPALSPGSVGDGRALVALGIWPPLRNPDVLRTSPRYYPGRRVLVRLAGVDPHFRAESYMRYAGGGGALPQELEGEEEAPRAERPEGRDCNRATFVEVEEDFRENPERGRRRRALRRREGDRSAAGAGADDGREARGEAYVTHRAAIAGVSADRRWYEVDVERAGGGGHVRVAVGSDAVHALNQPHAFRTTGGGPGGRLLYHFEDAARGSYDSLLVRAKVTEIAAKLAPHVAELDFAGKHAHLVQMRCVEAVRGCLDTTAFHEGLDRTRVTRPDDLGKLACHGQVQCHGGSSLMAFFLLPFSRALGIDVKYRGGFTFGPGHNPSAPVVSNKVELHQWLELTFLPSCHTVVCDFFLNLIDVPVAEAYSTMMYPNGQHIIGTSPVPVSETDVTRPDDLGKLACHGQVQCHGGSFFLLPFSRALGIDVKYRGGFTFGPGHNPSAPLVSNKVELHQWLELTFLPSCHTVVCDFFLNLINVPVAEAYGTMMYPNGHHIIGTSPVPVSETDVSQS
ncbi:Kinesin-like calmodulin-binding protein [Diplonema papillatum]|nr:Kinesin-like calmodulin-binding protein [Diplonema papillatum]